MFGFGILEIIYVSPILILLVLPFWKIFSKAGFSGGWSLLIPIPPINIFVIYYFAFAKWPIYKSKTEIGSNYKINLNEEDKPPW